MANESMVFKAPSNKPYKAECRPSKSNNLGKMWLLSVGTTEPPSLHRFPHAFWNWAAGSLGFQLGISGMPPKSEEYFFILIQYFSNNFTHAIFQSKSPILERLFFSRSATFVPRWLMMMTRLFIKRRGGNHANKAHNTAHSFVNFVLSLLYKRSQQASDT